MYFESVTVKNETGLHARPASEFTETAKKFKSKIIVSKGDQSANAKSILYLISLGVFKGDEIIISAEGPDEREAVTELVNLVNSGFGEK